LLILFKGDGLSLLCSDIPKVLIPTNYSKLFWEGGKGLKSIIYTNEFIITDFSKIDIIQHNNVNYITTVDTNKLFKI